MVDAEWLLKSHRELLSVEKAYANMIGTYSSEEINSISLILSARKKITYNVVVTKQNYTVLFHPVNCIDKMDQRASLFVICRMEYPAVQTVIC